MKAVFVLAVFSVFAVVGGRADASPIVVYNNFGPGQTFDNTNTWDVGGTNSFIGQAALAESFTPASTVTFDAVLLPLSQFTGTNSVVVSLSPDASGQPGATPIESFPLTGLTTFPTATVYQLNSVADPVLNAGTTYWITLFPGAADTVANWWFNSTGADQYSTSADGGATWQSQILNPAPAMEVLGNPVATPEPSAFAMLAGLGACAIGLTWKRRQAATR